ncbi:MAG: class B sortase [Anaerotruncus sp.]|nr:class B sortase [Anaerotruncus sp.]
MKVFHRLSKRLPVRRIVAGCFAVIALVSGSLWVRGLLRAAHERQANQLLAQQVQMAESAAQAATSALPPSQPETEPEASAPPRNLPQYDALWQQNHDFAGWLSLEGAGIDLPVLYTPQEPEYYLRRAFDGSSSFSGSLFLGAGWTPDANHAIIYGHNMDDGSMFGQLERYRSEEYARAHPSLRFDTLTQQREYEILGAFYSRVYTKQEQGVFRYYQYLDLSQEEVFQEYLRQVQASSLYDTGVTAQYGDRLLTLSTCSYYTDDGRFVLVARQKLT